MPRSLKTAGPVPLRLFSEPHRWDENREKIEQSFNAVGAHSLTRRIEWGVLGSPITMNTGNFYTIVSLTISWPVPVYLFAAYTVGVTVGTETSAANEYLRTEVTVDGVAKAQTRQQVKMNHTREDQVVHAGAMLDHGGTAPEAFGAGSAVILLRAIIPNRAAGSIQVDDDRSSLAVHVEPVLLPEIG